MDPSERFLYELAFKNKCEVKPLQEALQDVGFKLTSRTNNGPRRRKSLYGAADLLRSFCSQDRSKASRQKKANMVNGWLPESTAIQTIEEVQGGKKGWDTSRKAVVNTALLAIESPKRLAAFCGSRMGDKDLAGYKYNFKFSRGDEVIDGKDCAEIVILCSEYGKNMGIVLLLDTLIRWHKQHPKCKGFYLQCNRACPDFKGPPKPYLLALYATLGFARCTPLAENIVEQATACKKPKDPPAGDMLSMFDLGGQPGPWILEHTGTAAQKKMNSEDGWMFMPRLTSSGFSKLVTAIIARGGFNKAILAFPEVDPTPDDGFGDGLAGGEMSRESLEELLAGALEGGEDEDSMVGSLLGGLTALEENAGSSVVSGVPRQRAGESIEYKEVDRLSGGDEADEEEEYDRPEQGSSHNHALGDTRMGASRGGSSYDRMM